MARSWGCTLATVAALVSGCVVHEDYLFGVQGQADGPTLELTDGAPQAFEVTLGSDDWHLPAFAHTEVLLPDGVDVAVVDALGDFAGTSDGSSEPGATWFLVDLDDPGFDTGVERSFVAWLVAGRGPATGAWAVRIVSGGAHHVQVDASYDLAIEPCPDCVLPADAPWVGTSRR